MSPICYDDCIVNAWVSDHMAGGSGNGSVTMACWQRWVRHGLFYGMIAGWFMVNVPVSLFLLAMPSSWMVRYAPWVCKGFVRIATWAIGISYQVHGIQTPITGACVVASNHQSPWETLAYFDIVRNPTFLLKDSLLKVPLVGSILRKLGMVPVARGLSKGRNSDIVAKAGAVLQQGRPIVIFPEGTRVAPGATPRPYRSGYQKIAAHWNVPIIHLHIDSGVYWPARQIWKKPGVIQVYGHYGECEDVGCTRRPDLTKPEHSLGHHGPSSQAEQKSLSNQKSLNDVPIHP